MRKTVAVAIIGGLAVLTASCSSSQTEINKPTGAAAGTVAHLGDTLDLHTAAGRTFSITLVRVIDPAQGAGHNTPAAGKRYVAIVFHVSDTSSHSLSAVPRADVNVIGATGHMYSPAGVTLSSCTAFNNGQIHLAPGKSATGCVSFQFRTAVRVAKVQFYPAAGTANDFGEWLVP